MKFKQNKKFVKILGQEIQENRKTIKTPSCNSIWIMTPEVLTVVRMTSTSSSVGGKLFDTFLRVNLSELEFLLINLKSSITAVPTHDYDYELFSNHHLINTIMK